MQANLNYSLCLCASVVKLRTLLSTTQYYSFRIVVTRCAFPCKRLLTKDAYWFTFLSSTQLILCNLEPILPLCCNGSHIKLIDPDLDNSNALSWVATDEAISSNVIVVGIEDEIQPLELYPNPVQGSFTLMANSPIVSWNLRDYLGRLLDTGYAVSNFAEVDMTHYADGLYYISITTSDRTVVRKVMKE